MANPKGPKNTDETPGAFAALVCAASPGVTVGTVAAGEIWRFQARGRWRDAYIPCGPNGYKNFLADVADIRPQVEDADWFCVVGRLQGVPGSEFAIGEGCEHTFAQGGVLEVFANDRPDKRDNNHGHVQLRAARLARPLMPRDAMSDPLRFKGPLGAWRLVQRILEGLRGSGVITFLVVGLSWVLSCVRQGQDLIRSTAEDLGEPRTYWFFLLLALFALQAWVWTRLVINTNVGRRPRTWGPGAWALKWWPRVVGLIPFLAVEASLGVALHEGAPVGKLLVVGAVVAVVGAAYLAYVWTRDLQAWAKDEARTPRKGPSLAAIWVSFTTLLGLVGMITFVAWPVRPAQDLGATAVVFLGVGLLIPWLVIPSQIGRIFRIPVIPLLLFVALAFSIGGGFDNHAVGRRAFRDFGHEPYAPMDPRPDLDQAYAIWRKQAPLDHEGRPVMVLAIAEGGASRAGFWTGEVLSALQAQTGGRLTNALFAISSVSGGSVGAVGYDVVLKDDPSADPETLHRRLAHLTGADALSPTLAAFLFPDLLYRFAPVPGLPDRAQALEESWEYAWAQVVARKPKDARVELTDSFLTLRPEAGQPWRPILMVNGASQETGRRIFTSTILPVEGVDGYDFHALTNRDVAISTAIHNGARFPYVSPAGSLTVHPVFKSACVAAKDRRYLPDGRPAPAPPESCEAYAPQGHVIDGGYFDPVGTEAARELAEAVVKGPGAADDLHFVFVVISYGGKFDPKNPDAMDRLKVASWIKPTWWANELLAPPRGFLGSRDGHGKHMRVALVDDVNSKLRVVDAAGRPHNVATYAPVELCEPDGFAEPMNWVLSGRAKDSMRCAAGFSKAGGKPCEAVMTCPKTTARIQGVAAIINGKSAPTVP